MKRYVLECANDCIESLKLNTVSGFETNVTNDIARIEKTVAMAKKGLITNLGAVKIMHDIVRGID